MFPRIFGPKSLFRIKSIIYELKSLIDMLRPHPWSVSVPAGTELEYRLAARNRFLAHPQFRGVVRIVPGLIAVPVEGGMADFYVVSRNGSSTIMPSYYLRILGLSERNRSAISISFSLLHEQGGTS
jgi:hypothetical protein